MPSTPDEPPIPEFLRRWWTDKTPEQIASLAVRGRILWPETMKIRIEAGAVREVPIYLRTPDPIEKMQAVVAVNAKVASLFKITDPKMLPLSRDVAVGMVGQVEWDTLHSAYLMAFCILEATPIKDGPDTGEHRLMFLPQNIIAGAHMSTLYDLYSRLELYQGLEDVRLGEMTPEIFTAVVVNIARCMSLAPLYDLSGVAQRVFQIEMACEIVRLRAQLGESSSESPSTSTPD